MMVARIIRFNMTLRELVPGVAKRYIAAGTALGAMYPLFAFLGMTRDMGLARAAEAMVSDPLHAASLTFPVVAGYVALKLGQTHERLCTMIREREVREHQLMHDAFYDTLTGLPNRRPLERDLRAMLGRERGGALMMVDIDKFKFVNDTMGHDAGDAMLQRMASLMRHALCGAGELYRLGGDEFVILLPDVIDAETVIAIALRIEQDASRPLDLPQGRVAAGVSIGITFTLEGEYDLDLIFKRADLALYRAKEISGSSHAFFDSELAALALERIEIERDLRRALADGEFFLEYQPILNIASQQLVAFEALLRWHHPERGVIVPDAFIPLAEKAGIILPIGRWVLSEACREASQWPEVAGVAVNVPGDQFKDLGFVEHVRGVLTETGLEPHRLMIEVTESVFTVDVAIIQKALHDLRAMGIRVALDDFGTGFSSINNLKRFPLDHLKIDRSFTHAMMQGGSDGELVHLIAQLGSVFQLDTTIEGIENEAQLEFARMIGIRNVQGFLISPPVTAKEIPDLLSLQSCNLRASRVA